MVSHKLQDFDIVLVVALLLENKCVHLLGQFRKSRKLVLLEVLFDVFNRLVLLDHKHQFIELLLAG